MNRVWESSQATHGDLLVLLAIADFADDRGQAYPSVPTLMKKSRLSERGVQEAVKSLSISGELSVKIGAGPHGVNLYIIHIGSPVSAVSTPAKSAPPPQNLPPAKKRNTPADSAPPQTLPPANSALTPANFSKYPRKLCGGTIIEPSVEPSVGELTKIAVVDESVPQTERQSISDSDSLDSETASHPSEDSEQAGTKRPRRGSRLPAGWQPTDEDLAWAKKHVPDVDLERATLEFCNYWLSVAGSAGVKLAWSLTWQNAMLTSQDKRRFLKSRTAPSLSPDSSSSSVSSSSVNSAQVTPEEFFRTKKLPRDHNGVRVSVTASGQTDRPVAGWPCIDGKRYPEDWEPARRTAPADPTVPTPAAPAPTEATL